MDFLDFIFQKLGGILGDVSATAIIISALISAVVSFGVAKLTIKNDRDNRKFDRAHELLENVYTPVVTSLRLIDNNIVDSKLYEYMRKPNDRTHNLDNFDLLKKNRHEFTEEITPLIDRALDAFYTSRMSFGSNQDEERKVQDSKNNMLEIEKELIPLLEKEFNRLSKVIK